MEKALAGVPGVAKVIDVSKDRGEALDRTSIELVYFGSGWNSRQFWWVQTTRPCTV